MRDFNDKVAVVTGAASGIGRALAEALARRGADLALVDVDEVGLAETATLVAACGRKASIHRVDVSDRTAMSKLPEAVVAEHGHVHLLVNNAGVSVTEPFETQSLEDFEWIVGVNFWGVVYGCKFFLPELRKVDEAHIVNLSSMFGIVGIPTQSSYCATKFAVRGFSEALHAELGATKIGVTVVHPGGVRTNIVRGGRTDDEEARTRTIEAFERFAMAPETAAEKIVRAITRRRTRLVICREAIAADWLKRLLPTATQRLVRWSYARRGGRLF